MPVKLIKYLPHLVGALVLAVTLWLAYHQGFQTAFTQQAVVITQIQLQQQADALAAEQAYTAKLAEANKRLKQQEQQNQTTAAALAAANDKTRAKTLQIKKGIDHAINQDRAAAADACIDGFGNYSLRQYKQALGYRD